MSVCVRCFVKKIGIVCLCVLALHLYGCKSAAVENYFAYQEKDFEAEISGELNGAAFVALVKAETMTSGERLLHLIYLSHPSLAGVELEIYPDQTVQLLLGELTLSSHCNLLSDLLLPIELLLVSDAPLSVQKQNELLLLSLPNDVSLSLANNRLVSVASPSCSFRVIWWEGLEG